MTEQAKIWAVSQGSYSDYSVVAVFTTEALAEETAAKEDSWYVEEFPFFDHAPALITWWEARVDDSQPEAQVYAHSTGLDGGPPHPSGFYLPTPASGGALDPTNQRSCDWVANHWAGHRSGVIVIARAWDRERAIKVASDRHAMLTARNWPTAPYVEAEADRCKP